MDVKNIVGYLYGVDMTRQEAINILLDHFSEGMVRTIVDALVEDEREECAKLCEEYFERVMASRIRARGK